MFVFLNAYFNSYVWGFVCTPYVCLPEESVKAPGTEVTDGFEPPCGVPEIELGFSDKEMIKQ